MTFRGRGGCGDGRNNDGIVIQVHFVGGSDIHNDDDERDKSEESMVAEKSHAQRHTNTNKQTHTHTHIHTHTHTQREGNREGKRV